MSPICEQILDVRLTVDLKIKSYRVQRESQDCEEIKQNHQNIEDNEIIFCIGASSGQLVSVHSVIALGRVF